MIIEAKSVVKKLERVKKLFDMAFTLLPRAWYQYSRDDMASILDILQSIVDEYCHTENKQFNTDVYKTIGTIANFFFRYYQKNDTYIDPDTYKKLVKVESIDIEAVKTFIEEKYINDKNYTFVTISPEELSSDIFAVILPDSNNSLGYFAVYCLAVEVGSYANADIISTIKMSGEMQSLSIPINSDKLYSVFVDSSSNGITYRIDFDMYSDSNWGL